MLNFQIFFTRLPLHFMGQIYIFYVKGIYLHLLYIIVRIYAFIYSLHNVCLYVIMINEIPINNVEEENNNTLCVQQPNQLGIHVRTQYKILFLRDFGHLVA